MLPLDLNQALKDQKPGDWVVLNAAMTKVLASSKIAENAISEAERTCPEEARDSLLLMVPDPNTVCIY
jgi:hypothetical protein